jgi:hypothetical protein
LQPAAVPALQALLSAASAKAQQTGSAEILQAYLAIAEPGAEAPDGAPTRAAAPPSANDDAQRGLPVPPARADDGAAKPANLPWLAFLVPEASPQRRASGIDAATKRGQATSRPHDVAEPANRQQMRVGLMALAAGFLALAIIGLTLLVHR